MIHKAAAQPVHKVAFEYAVFYEHIALGRISLVVAAYAAPLPLESAVIYGGYLFACYPLAQLAAEFGISAAYGCGLKGMDAGLVEYYPAKAAVYGNRHIARRAFRGVQHGDGCLCGGLSRSGGIYKLIGLKAHAVCGPLAAGLVFLAVCCHRVKGKAGAGTAILCPYTFGIAYEHPFIRIKVSCAYSVYLIGYCLCGVCALKQQGDSLGVVYGGEGYAILPFALAYISKVAYLGSFSRDYSGRAAGGVQQRLKGGIHRIGIGGLCAGKHPNARPLFPAVSGVFHHPLQHGYAVAFRVLHIQLRKVAPGFKGLCQYRFRVAPAYHSLSSSFP